MSEEARRSARSQPGDETDVVDDLERKTLHQPEDDGARETAPDAKAPESPTSETSSTSAASEPPD